MLHLEPVFFLKKKALKIDFLERRGILIVNMSAKSNVKINLMASLGTETPSHMLKIGPFSHLLIYFSFSHVINAMVLAVGKFL